VRDPFFVDADPAPDAGAVAERWVAALKLAVQIDQRLPGILIDMAGGLTQEAAARRAGMPLRTLGRGISRLRANKHVIKTCNKN
jgi:hypothetical protein